ncbi:MAG: hypothetical protein HW414_273 [Dehalococcoidia bacterium]|nr:hypothetical protein [Dehalococcoidia bacterium]
MPIRWRLTLWFSLILLIVLTLTGGVLYTVLQSYLTNEVDDNLRAYSAHVHGTLKSDELPQPLDYDVIHAKLPLVNEFASPGLYIQILDRNDVVVVKSDNLGQRELPVSPTLVEKGFSGSAVIETVPSGVDARVRIMASALYLRDQTLLLEVAQSLKPIDVTMSRLRWALLAATLVALILASLSGAGIVRRALAPVERISRIAQSIEASSDLSRRVAYKGPSDEIANLATTFDHMIEHLSKVFESQKNFIADASHELRSPLTVMQGNLDLLKRKISEEDRRASKKSIEAETERMGKIVNDLLLLAEVESGPVERRETVSLAGIVLEEVGRAQSLSGNRRIVVGRLEGLSLSGDTYRLRQLLSNLVDNAVRYTQDAGTVTLSLVRDDRWARLEVADNGIGISPEHLPNIFDRFYRVDKSRSRAGGGTGLGLAIVKGIAEQYGGKVKVTSEPGKGSTFTVWLSI